jgi:hypothetical protein
MKQAMSGRVAVQCVVLLLAAPLAACGGGTGSEELVPAASLPHHAPGRLHRAEYVQLRRAFRPAGNCADVSRRTELLAAVRRECRSAEQLVAALARFTPRLQACVAQRSQNCAEGVFDGAGARFEELVRLAHGVHRSLVRRHFSPACRTAIQGPPRAFASLRGLGASARELSADIDAGDLNGYISSAQRFVASARRLVADTSKPEHALRRLRRCPRS